MMSYFKALSLSLCIFILPSHFLAWGHAGHAMVAELAMTMLSDATRVKVQQVLLNQKPGKAANWMDDIRSSEAYRYMIPWHYINIDSGSTYKHAPEYDDIVSVLRGIYADLQHVDTLNPLATFKWTLVLFHLCGDLQLRCSKIRYASGQI